jgi:hypothetical protein
MMRRPMTRGWRLASASAATSEQAGAIASLPVNDE